MPGFQLLLLHLLTVLQWLAKPAVWDACINVAVRDICGCSLWETGCVAYITLKPSHLPQGAHEYLLCLA